MHQRFVQPSPAAEYMSTPMSAPTSYPTEKPTGKPTKALCLPPLEKHTSENEDDPIPSPTDTPTSNPTNAPSRLPTNKLEREPMKAPSPSYTDTYAPNIPTPAELINTLNDIPDLLLRSSHQANIHVRLFLLSQISQLVSPSFPAQ